MRLAAEPDAAWRALLAHPSLRGTLAGYTGTAVLEEADDDERVARFRLHGTRAGEPATATITAALSPAGAGTELDLHAEVHGDMAPEALLTAAAAAATAALAARAEAGPAAAPAGAGPDEVAPATPPGVAAPAESAPVAPAVVAAPGKVAPPAPPGLSAPAKRALAAAGAAAVVALALRGRR